MAKNLVIVESPAKAKTIQNFLGKDFQVSSCFGHVRDLPASKISIDVENDFEPKYEISADKKKVVDGLKKEAKKADTVWLASDEDREGEAIAWHLSVALDLKEENIKRIVFHEITKTAILDAVASPRTINIDLVNAQQARRVLDRLVGYELSPVLWKKVKPSLSAGRVQSVAVRLIVERERDIRNHKTTTWYKLTAEFTHPNGTIKAEIPERFTTKEQAQQFLEACINADFTISGIETKPGKKSPSPPFTTSTLQQEAGRKLGFSVAKTMMVAQQLYEQGSITYMRTDSVNLSKLVLNAAKQSIENTLGSEYSKVRQFSTKSKGAQEAHEAIRPTNIENNEVGGPRDQVRLYDLIWKRTIASQMSDAQLERTSISIAISGSDKKFVAQGEVITFDGFLKVYLETNEEGETVVPKGMLPKVVAGDTLAVQQIEGTQRFSQSPVRYTEPGLVKKMEELGIGRPSTYAPTISTIQKRQYVVKEDRQSIARKYNCLILKEQVITDVEKSENVGGEKAKLFPTDIGTVVNDFLTENFETILDYNFTADVEKEFDKIANGSGNWHQMIASFYHPFHERIETVTENGERVKSERILGVDPETGKNVITRIGRFGPMIQLGDTEGEEKPRFAGLKKEQSIETITLEEALKQLSFPRLIGDFEEKEVVVGVGRFGPYVRHNSKFYSLPKGADATAIDYEACIDIIQTKRIEDAKKVIQIFEAEDISILNGRYGPYIAHKKKNYKIPKTTDPASLTLEECKEMIAKAPPPAKRGRKKS